MIWAKKELSGLINARIYFFPRSLNFKDLRGLELQNMEYFQFHFFLKKKLIKKHHHHMCARKRAAAEIHILCKKVNAIF